MHQQIRPRVPAWSDGSVTARPPTVKVSERSRRSWCLNSQNSEPGLEFGVLAGRTGRLRFEQGKTVTLASLGCCDLLARIFASVCDSRRERFAPLCDSRREVEMGRLRFEPREDVPARLASLTGHFVPRSQSRRVAPRTRSPARAASSLFRIFAGAFSTHRPPLAVARGVAVREKWAGSDSN